jgi:hypothetical protein
VAPCQKPSGSPYICSLHNGHCLKFTARLRIFHVCRNENFRNRYLSFYWKKWFYTHVFDIWLLHGELYRVSPFHVYRTSTSCLPRDLEFFMFAVMKTFVTDISASTGKNDFIFDIWLLHGDLCRVSPFQVYCTLLSYRGFFQCHSDITHRAGSCVCEQRHCRQRCHIYNINTLLRSFCCHTVLPVPASLLMFKNVLYFSARLVQVFNFHVVITKCFSLWLHKSLLCTFQPVYNDLYWFIMICAELDVSD